MNVASVPVWRMHSAQLAAFQSKARTNVIVAGRRWGKSEVACMWALAGAHDDRLRKTTGVTWWVAPTFDLTRPMWRKMLRLAPPGWITGTKGSESQPDFLELGGSRLEFKSADHPERLVAEGLRRVVVDECGIVKEGVWTESLLPALLDHSAPAFLVGTPKGRNWFHRMYQRGKDPLDAGVESFGGPSMQNPFIPEDEIRRLAGEMPERLYRQEIMAEFLDDEGAVFRGVRACVSQSGEPSYEPTIVLGVDLARTHDFTVLIGLDAKGRQTYFERFNEVSWPLQKQRIELAAKRSGATVLIDSTGLGDPVTQDLQNAGVKVDGFKISAATKPPLIEALAMAIEGRTVELADEPVLLNELESYEYETTRTGHVRYSAPEGAHDDCVIALALANWALTHRPEIKRWGAV